MATWEGRLLVATPALDGPPSARGFFSRTVIQLLQHTAADGALGLVVNRPLEADLVAGLPDWVGPSVSAQVFSGGPVQPSAALCLGQLAVGARPNDSWSSVAEAPWLAVLDLAGDLPEDIARVRVFVGYAGWSPGQLEAEVDEGSWWVLDALPGDCFSSEPEALWSQVLRRQGMPLALAASYPADPTLN